MGFGAIALSYPLRVRVRATVTLSAAFFHDESSITIEGYKSAIAPKKHLKKREILAFKPLLIRLKNLTGTERKDFLKLLTSKLWNKKYKLPSIPHEQNYVVWSVKNGKSAFSKLMLKISLSVSGEQASKNTALGLQFSFFRILDTSPSLLDGYFSEISCTYCFREMFNGFWTSNFYFYWSLALKFSCITVIRPGNNPES